MATYTAFIGSLDLGPCLLKDWTPHGFISTSCKDHLVNVDTFTIMGSPLLLIEADDELVIDCDNPWLSPDEESDSINTLLVHLLVDKGILNDLWVLG